MKRFYSDFLHLLTLSLIFSFLPFAKSEAATYQQLTILGKDHTVGSGAVSGEYLMSLLDDGAKEWVERIECANVTVFGSNYLGVVLTPDATTGEDAYVRFILKKDNRMVPSMIFAYGKSLNQTAGSNLVPMQLICNGDESFIVDPKFKDLPTNRTTLLSTLSQTEIAQRGTYASVATNLNLPIGLTSIELRVYAEDGVRPRYQFVGFGVTYTALNDANLPTIVEEVISSDDSPAQYFDPSCGT